MTGLMALIPSNIRKATAGIASALANPIDKLADKVQVKLQEESQKLIMNNLAKAKSMTNANK